MQNNNTEVQTESSNVVDEFAAAPFLNLCLLAD